MLSSPALAAAIVCSCIAAVTALVLLLLCVCRATVWWQRAASGSRWGGREGRLLQGGAFPEYGVGVVAAGSSKSPEPSLTGSLFSRNSRGSSWRSSATGGDAPGGSTAADSRSEETVSVGSGKELGSLEPSLYTRKEGTVLIMPAESGNGQRRSGHSTGQKNSEETKLGQVVFRLGYNFNTSDLLVHVLRATDLVSCDRQKDFVDPFITLSLEPPIDSKERQTSLQRRTSCPTFDQTFKFPIDFDSLEGHRLRLLVQDFDKFSRHAPVGEFSADLGSIDVTSEPEVVGSLRSVDENQYSNGELLFSLSLLPGAEKLTIAVMKARNLRQINSEKSMDPYVRVTLLHEEKGIKKRKKTTSKKRALNPVWNEAMTFRVTPDLLHGLSVEVAMLDKDLLGQDATIGSVRLGNSVDCRSGRQHWMETVANPRRALAMWHPLTASATGAAN
ncbi:hypothetical protein BOX15_Mlig022681g1 [Macrostomum lignano]|uniref:C2 domain-containing protein n=1 Tax=Macrostomum lignano TaxID=282301 RepID=A0A267E996_9PLAT|nr:hypothetical protein BOX15_Mlig022681g1 [Macrostomum lignano]